MKSRLLLMLIAAVLGIAADKPKPKKAQVQAAPLPPAEAFKRLTTLPDLKLEPVLTEPAVTQPIFLNFDERGRMWVVQYRQYPYPAGLKILSEDKFLRAVYDKVPPPPPHHFKGEDRITIHESTRGDGVFDKATTFVDGLNIATSCVKGRGGVWVLNPPYLLFYPDKNNDDVPDGDPVVHLQGFGLEDTHSNANSLQWGPDGWLYAAQGSTVSGAIKHYGVKDEKPVHSMGQLIWRYHPETRRYEIFAEGGGNAFGVEIDAKGRIFSGHNGGNTRGFHYVQGGYYQKGFGKHGPLSNPYTFGYFAAMKHPAVPRFTHTFIVYEGGALPRHYEGKIFAVCPLLNYVVCTDRFADGSSFQTKDLSFPIQSSDPWFRPVDVKSGPDGAVYVADMYEGQIAHLRHHEGKIDRSNGRIYRISGHDTKPVRPFDHSKKTTAEICGLLRHPNRWHRRMALVLLGDRRDRSAIPILTKMLEDDNPQTALEALWGLNASGGFDDALALRTLAHGDPHVRLWTVRLLGDARRVSPEIAGRLATLARAEPNLEARVQLAGTAKRLPANQALPIVRGLLARDEDVADVHQPLLLWWALESKCGAAESGQVVKLFEDPAIWKLRMVQTHHLHRLMRRFAQTGSRHDLLICAALLKRSPDAETSTKLLRGFKEAYKGRPLANLPVELTEALARYGGDSIELGLRQNKPQAVDKALAVLGNDRADNDERLTYIQVFSEIKQPRSVPALLRIAETSRDDALRLAALTALSPYADQDIARRVVALHGKLNDDARAVAQTLLTGRKTWALAFLEAIDGGKIDRNQVPVDSVRKLTLFRDERIDGLLKKHWGNIEGANTAEMKAEVARLEEVLRRGTGKPSAGKKLFIDTCARCHKLFGKGGQVGPDLTAFKRDDVANMLAHIVNPSAEIREGYETTLITTTDGRVLTGVLVEKDNQVVVLRGADGQNVTIRNSQIEEPGAQKLKKSLMPEGLLKALKEQQVRDLFAYLRSTQPLNEKNDQ